MVYCCILHPNDAKVLSMEGSYCLPTTKINLFKNCNVFDGVNEAMLLARDVYVQGKKIVKIIPTGTAVDEINMSPEDLVLECEGRTLMPGLIDVHWHTVLAEIDFIKMVTNDLQYMTAIAVESQKKLLLRGFTTIRDTGGNCYGIKKATDEGIIVGPHIYPSGAMICQTSGHFDFRGYNDVPSNPGDALNYHQRNAHYLLADGVPECLKRTREALRLGSSQIKIAGGGGVSSMYDPVDVQEYTFDEVKAVVDAAACWGTYVTAHVFSDQAVRNCADAGVKCIEHGMLCSNETLDYMKEKGMWLSLQMLFNDEDGVKFAPGSIQEQKYLTVTEGTLKVGKYSRENGMKVAWGTDTLFDPNMSVKQGKALTKLVTTLGYSPYEALVKCTSNNAELCKLCGPRDPYPDLEFGVVKEGACADLLLVDGNPLDDIHLIADPSKNFKCIMKEGTFYKNEFVPKD